MAFGSLSTAQLANLTAGASAVSAGSQVAGGVTSFLQARERAGVQERAGALEAERVRRARRRQIESTRAAFGARGVQMTGTPLDVLADAEAEAEMDARLARFRGDLSAADTRATGASRLARGVTGASTTLLQGLTAANRIDPSFSGGAPDPSERIVSTDEFGRMRVGRSSAMLGRRA